MERLAIDQRSSGVDSSANVNANNDPSLVLSPAQADKAQREEGDVANGNNKNGSMRKKLSGKTYHHIKDMFTTKFNKSSKSKLNGTENNATVPPAVNSAAAVAAAAEAIIAEHTGTVTQNGAANHMQRQPDPVHSINQRIKSQLAGQMNNNNHNNSNNHNNNPQQVWGSYGRQSARMEASINDSDASALAKLTLSPPSNGPESLVPTHSPYNLRHKPSVTFRMDLNNECQYSGGDNSSSSAAASAIAGPAEPRYGTRAGQGQIVLYDDTMHFPQHQQPPKEAPPSKSVYGEHDSSLSSIASAGQGMKTRTVFTYSDYDVPQKSVSLSSPMMNEGGSSSGHQSAGSSSDLDKRSGQSVSTNDSGLGVLNDPSGHRGGRMNGQQSYHLDTSTETEMFVGRGGQLNQSSSDWADAADREVNNVMEMRSYQSKQQQQQQQQGLQSATPPLPPLSPDASPKPTPKLQQKFSNSKPDLLEPANGPSPMVQRVKPTTPAKSSSAMQRNAANENSTKSGHNAKRRGEDKSSSGPKSLSTAKLRGASKSTGKDL